MNQITRGEVGVDQPQRPDYGVEYSRHPTGRNGPLQRAVGEPGLVMERINNGDVALHAYQYQVINAHVGGNFYNRRGNRYGHVVVTRVVEDVQNEEQRRIPECEDTEDDVGHQQAGKDEVGLGPESARQPDCDQRKPVATQIEYRQHE